MTRLPEVLLGDVVQPVLNWNPQRSGDGSSFQYIDLSSVDQDTKVITAARSINCTDAPSRARQLVAAGDVLVSTVRPNLNGVAVVLPEMDGATASTGFCVLRPNPDCLDSRFLFYWVRSPRFIDSMVRQATGASYPAITDRTVLSSSIYLPPLAEQRRIADLLDRADVLRNKRLATIDQLDTLARSIFLDTFEKFLSAPPDVTLNDIAEPVRGSFVNGPFGSNLLTSELVPEGVPVIYIRDIRGGEYVRVSAVCVTPAKARQLAVCSVRPGDVLVAKVGDPPGVAAVYPPEGPEAVVTQDVIRIRVSDTRSYPAFVSAYLNSEYGKRAIAGITVEATRSRFSLRDFKRITIPLPPLSLQADFAARIAAVETMREKARVSVKQFDALFASLIHNAFG